MKYVDEFRDPEKARTLTREIHRLVDRIVRDRGGLKRPLQIMEVCGGHTHSIFRYGIHQMLPPEVEFVHGPGCPVCVLPMGRVDDCSASATQSYTRPIGNTQTGQPGPWTTAWRSPSGPK